MKWTDHIDARTATKDEIIEFIQQRERLAWESLNNVKAISDDETLIKSYRSEWAALYNLTYALGL